MPTEAASRATADHLRVAAEGFEQGFGQWQCVADQMAGGISPALIDSFEDVRLSLFAKALELSDSAGLASPFEFFDTVNAQFVMEHFDFLRTQAGDVEHGYQPGRHGSSELFVVDEFAGGNQFSDLLLQSFTDAFDLAQSVLGDQFFQRVA